MAKKPNSGPATPFLARPGREFTCTEVQITAERIRLLPVSEAHAADLFENFTAEVTRYMTPQPTGRIKDTIAFIRSSLQGMAREENLQFVIIHKESGEFLGACGLHGQGCPRTPELGIWIKVDAHGNGYGREAITAVKQWADENLLYNYLVYPVDRDNVPSRKIPEALDGQIFEEALCPRQGGGFLDVVIYRIYPPREEDERSIVLDVQISPGERP